MSLTLEDVIDDCRKGIDQLRKIIKTYEEQSTAFEKLKEEFYNKMEQAKLDFRTAQRELLQTPRTAWVEEGVVSVNDQTSKWIGNGDSACNKRCVDKYGTKFPGHYLASITGGNDELTYVDSPYITRTRAKSWAKSGCWWAGCWGPDTGPYQDYTCFCQRPEPVEHGKRKDKEQRAWQIYQSAIQNYQTHIREALPNPPKRFYNFSCCINELEACKEGRCTGVIQTCEQVLELAEKQLDNKDQIQKEKDYHTDNIRIKELTNTILGMIDEIIVVFGRNLSNILNNIINTKNPNTTINYIDKIFQSSTNIYENMNSAIQEFESSKNQANRNFLGTTKESIYFSSINDSNNIIKENFTTVREKWLTALKIYRNIKFQYDTLKKDKSNKEECEKILEDLNIIKNKINEDFENIISKSYNIDQIKSTKDEDIKSIERLTKEAIEILTIKIRDEEYIETVQKKIDRVNFLLLTYGPDSPFKRFVEQYKISADKIQEEIIINYNKIVTLVNEMITITNNLKKDFNNYDALKTLKEKTNSIIKSIDVDFDTYNKFYNKAKNIVINNEDDLLRLEELKNDAIRFYNKKESFDNMNDNSSPKFFTITEFKEQTNNLLNETSTDSIFYNKIVELVDEIKSILENNESKYNIVTGFLTNIEKIYLEKKDIFLNNKLLQNEDIIKSDKILFNEIKKNELLNDKTTENNTIYIYIIIVIIAIILLVYFFIQKSK